MWRWEGCRGNVLTFNLEGRGQEKGMSEGEMVRQQHQLNGHEFEQTLGDSEGQGGLVCCHPCGHEESDTTQQLNNRTWLIQYLVLQLVPVEILACMILIFLNNA